jgi:hypothetical protein
MVAGAVAVVSSLAVTGIALAGSPKAGQLYTSKYLTITVGKPAKTATVFVECLPKSGHGATWRGKVPLKNGAISFSHKESLSKLPKGKKTGTVDVTAKFKGSDFSGSWRLSGTPCGKTSFKATTQGGGTGY